MDKLNLNPDILKSMMATGTVKRVTVVAGSAGFSLLVRAAGLQRPLTTFRGNVRAFKNLKTALHYLHSLGVTRFDVDISEYQP